MPGETFFKKTILPSGLRVMTEHMPQVRSVALGYWLGVGSRDEDDDVGGMSHFIEHLLFKGTKNRSSREISEAFDTLGAEFNAFTAKEYTCYYTRLIDQHVETGIEILSDMIQNPLFATDDIQSERKVVLEEINLHEDSPDERIHDLFMEALWPTHALGKPILGHAETVDSFTAEDVLGYYRQEYIPKNMILAVAGNVDHDMIVEFAQKHFTSSGGDRVGRKHIAPHVEKKLDVYTKKTEQAHICLGTEAIPANDNRRYTLSILDNILGGGMSSRLFQEIREKRGLAYSTYSYHSLYAETGMVAAYAGTAPDNTEQVIKLVQEQIEGLANGSATDEEIYRAKESIKGHLVLGLESTGRRMTRLGKLEITDSEILSLDALVEKIDAVTRAGVTELAQELFKPEKMVLTVIGPFELEKLAHLA